MKNFLEQCSLESEVTLDPMEGEQTWPTEDDLKEIEGKKLLRMGVSERDGYDSESIVLLTNAQCQIRAKRESLKVLQTIRLPGL